MSFIKMFIAAFIEPLPLSSSWISHYLFKKEFLIIQLVSLLPAAIWLKRRAFDILPILVFVFGAAISGGVLKLMAIDDIQFGGITQVIGAFLLMIAAYLPEANNVKQVLKNLEYYTLIRHFMAGIVSGFAVIPGLSRLTLTFLSLRLLLKLDLEDAYLWGLWLGVPLAGAELFLSIYKLWGDPLTIWGVFKGELLFAPLAFVISASVIWVSLKVGIKRLFAFIVLIRIAMAFLK